MDSRNSTWIPFSSATLTIPIGVLDPQFTLLRKLSRTLGKERCLKYRNHERVHNNQTTLTNHFEILTYTFKDTET